MKARVSSDATAVADSGESRARGEAYGKGKGRRGSGKAECITVHVINPFISSFCPMKDITEV